jgi:predicted GNAT family acetyltransferase
VRLTTYPSAATFLDAVRPALGEREAEHHMLLGVAEAAANGSVTSAELFAASVIDANGLALAALMARDRPLLVASDREDLASAAGTLWDGLRNQGLQPKYLTGAVNQIDAVVAEWTRHEGRAAQLAMRQRVHRLTVVDPLPPASGSLRVATMADLDLVAEWTQEFEAEALAAVMPKSSRGSAERRIGAGEVYLWCDREPHTMAAWARPTKRAVAVNGVYTPLKWRRRGYATRCVADLSALLLRRGFEFCVLYTDLSNPTSNAIYSRIGYRPVRDFLVYELPATT